MILAIVKPDKQNYKASILKSIRKGVEEVKKHKQGKSKLLTVDEFFSLMKK